MPPAKRERPAGFNPMAGVAQNLDVIYGVHNPAGVRDSQVTKEIEVDAIQPNPFQPRKEFDEEGLEGLATSIRNHGLIQPLVVTFRDNVVYLVSGERRLRAAKLAGLPTVPCIEREKLSDEELEDLAFEENVHRANLTPLEEGYALDRYMKRHSLTTAATATRRGISRATVIRRLALVVYPEIAQAVADGRLTADQGANIALYIERPGHAALRQATLTALAGQGRLTPQQLDAALGTEPAGSTDELPAPSTAGNGTAILDTTPIAAPPAAEADTSSGVMAMPAAEPGQTPEPGTAPPARPAGSDSSRRSALPPTAAPPSTGVPDSGGLAAPLRVTVTDQYRRLQELQDLATWLGQRDLLAWIDALPPEMREEYVGALRTLHQHIPTILQATQTSK